MKLASWNVNGIRACHKNGFLNWFEDVDADVVCIQETKARKEQLDEEIAHPGGYHSSWFSAEKAGYSGVATFSREEPLSIKEGLGIPEFDSEGRVLITEFKNFHLINSYFPNSQRDHARLPYKVSFCKEMLKYCERLRKKGKNVVLCGDYNIAHREIDLKNPKANKKNAGFLPQERAWMDEFLEAGYIDIFRHFEKGPDFYTWWSYRPGVREKNIGWRLDYFCSNGEFEDRLKSMKHLDRVKGSDHCPVLFEVKS